MVQSLVGSVRPSIFLSLADTTAQSQNGEMLEITNIKKLTLESLKFQVLLTISVSSECVFKESVITMGTGTVEGTIAR